MGCEQVLGNLRFVLYNETDRVVKKTIRWNPGQTVFWIAA